MQRIAIVVAVGLVGCHPRPAEPLERMERVPVPQLQPPPSLDEACSQIELTLVDDTIYGCVYGDGLAGTQCYSIDPAGVFTELSPDLEPPAPRTPVPAPEPGVWVQVSPTGAATLDGSEVRFRDSRTGEALEGVPLRVGDSDVLITFDVVALVPSGSGGAMLVGCARTEAL
jgi:hypothetical protein